MRAIIQRVKKASVKVDDKIIGQINKGLLVLLAVHQDDPSASSPRHGSGQAGQAESVVKKMADKILNLRIFSDDNGKMNLSVKDVGGEIMVVSQFTLYGDCKKGNRPSFAQSAKPDKAIPFYKKFVQYIRGQGVKAATGKFGAIMEVELVNDGPVTIILDDR